MERVVIRRSRSEQAWAIAVTALGVLIIAFSYSIVAGALATIAILLGAYSFSDRLKEFTDNQPVVLELDEIGLIIGNTMYKGKCIPWSDLEDVGLSHGGRSGTVLNLRLRSPESYVGTFMRANMVLSRFHICIPVAGLELSPSEILHKVQEQRRLCAQPGVQADRP